VLLAAGQVNTHRIVVATGGPTALFKPLARHFDACSTFNVLTEPVPARIRKPLGTHDHLLRDCDTPPHRIAWVDDERLLIGGADTAAVPPRTRDKVLIQRTGQLMYELSTFYPDISGLMPAFGWDTPYWRTSNGLPVIGPHRNYPFHLFAFGDASQSVTGAFLASRVLLRLHADEPQPSDAAFAFGH
jgi:glycine/D-amino acid oxidase-like deaminating enzyme